MRTAAILPVKRFTRAKQRLGASAADPLHGELVPAMVADVLLALSQTASIERTIVVTSERSLAAVAKEQGALVVEDALESGQSEMDCASVDVFAGSAESADTTSTQSSACR